MASLRGLRSKDVNWLALLRFALLRCEISFECGTTVDGRHPANQLIWEISNYLHGFVHPRWCRIFPSTVCQWYYLWLILTANQMCFSDIWALFAKRSGKSCVWRRVSGYRVFSFVSSLWFVFLAIQLTVLDVSGRLFWRKHTVQIPNSLNINTLKQSTFSDVPFCVAYLFVYSL